MVSSAMRHRRFARLELRTGQAKRKLRNFSTELAADFKPSTWFN